MSLNQRSLFCILTLLMITPAGAQDKKEWIQPEEARQTAHFKIQGEYAGEVVRDGATVKIGVQVIAMSDTTFQSTIFIGGLPGAGWERGDRTRTSEGKLDGELVAWTSEEGNVTRTKQVDGGIGILDDSGTVAVVIPKVQRQSKTLDAKPPEGAMVLFDGSAESAKNFERGEVVFDKLLRHDCETKEKFGDHKLHLEFRTPYMPFARGQGRGNSGMYIQGRYEVQVLDSFGLEGKNNECGGIYSISVPRVNMCLPPLSWQTYDYDFTAAKYDTDGQKTTNARVTIKHNGVVIHDDLELPNHTPGKHEEADSPGLLYLQGHGNPVVYRNIWVVKK